MAGRHSAAALARPGISQVPADLAEEKQQRRADCALVEQVFPSWLVLWGAHSREFFAFPTFDAPAGTMASGSSPNDVARRMRAIERAALGERW